MTVSHCCAGSWQPQYVSSYAETHFRPLWLPWHLLYSRFPEVLFDAPLRVPRGSSHFPLLLTVRDADRFPVELSELQVEFAGPPGTVFKIPGCYHHDQPWAHHIFQIPLPAGQHFVRCRVRFNLQQGKTSRSFINDSYPGRYRPFNITVNRDISPRFPGSYSGDLHFHSSLSSDQVEFGAPLPLLQAAMRSLELDFTAITDHSYDLTEEIRWQQLQQEAADLNESDPAHLLLPAEEVSVRSDSAHNIHLLVLNDPKLYPGTGDSGRSISRRSELDLPRLLQQLHSGAVAIAAHPGEQPGKLEQLLLRRASWENSDCSQLRLFQIANGSVKGDLTNGIKLWLHQLQQGKRAFIVAGNDAHGDFNQSRRMRIPFATIGRSGHHRTGWWQTVVFSEQLRITELLSNITRGRSFITTGPQLAFEQRGLFMPEEFDPVSPLTLHLISSRDFGQFKSVLLHQGTKTGERTVALDINQELQQEITISPHLLEDSEYLRTSGSTVFGNQFFSNPLFRSAS